jgi:hypothetical protein
MEDFPPVTATKKQDLRKKPETGKDPSEAPEKKVEKVVSGKVVRRKKTLGTRIREMFTGSDADSVKEYIIQDVLVPALKDMISDATSGGIDRILYKDSHRHARRSRRGDFGRDSHTAYNKAFSSGPRQSRYDDPRDRPRPQHSARRRSNELEEVILATRAEAEEVLDRMYALLERYDATSVSDLNELLGLTGQYTDDKWGWLDLRGSGVRRIREGYLLELPEPQPLD